MFKKSSLKSCLALVLSLSIMLSLSGCSTKKAPSDATNSIPEQDLAEWSVYWYLCGSDLESLSGSATEDLEEALAVKLPPKVNLVIQTGGTSAWKNDYFDASKNQRFLYNSDGLQLLEESEPANMGDAATLEGFLQFAQDNYPAKQTMALLWNHGGGSISGVAFDENYDMDSLTLDEMRQAFSGVYDLDTTAPPIDIIGFDACLMATIDVASAFSDVSRYLVASEELVPGQGWNYTGWLGVVAANTAISAKNLGTAICDTYMDYYTQNELAESVTLSLVDLAKIPTLVELYDDFGNEALTKTLDDPGFLAKFCQVAYLTENYGGNTREQGFTNMLDMGHLARGLLSMLPDTAPTLLNGISDAVVYTVNGPYRTQSTGLSCYYPYGVEDSEFEAYKSLGVGESFKYLYEYGVLEQITEESQAYFEGLNHSVAPTLPSLTTVNWEDTPISVSDQGTASINLGASAYDVLTSIEMLLFYVSYEEDLVLGLGVDNDLVCDWENGIFQDRFRGTWGSIDGNLVYMEIDYVGDDYNRYSVPILLNDESYNLSVVYDFTKAEYSILGARKGIDASGAGDKNLRQLAIGDVIKTIHFTSSISGGSDEISEITVDEIIVTADTRFKEMDLGDGTYVMFFSMNDAHGNNALSAPVTFNYKDGVLVTTAD